MGISWVSQLWGKLDIGKGAALVKPRCYNGKTVAPELRTERRDWPAAQTLGLPREFSLWVRWKLLHLFTSSNPAADQRELKDKIAATEITWASITKEMDTEQQMLGTQNCLQIGKKGRPIDILTSGSKLRFRQKARVYK